MPGRGIMFVGEKGVQMSAFYGGNPGRRSVANPTAGPEVRGLPGGWLLPESQFKDFKQPPATLAALREAGSLQGVGTHVQSRQEVHYAHRIRLRADGVRLAGDAGVAQARPAHAAGSGSRRAVAAEALAAGEPTRFWPWDYKSMKITNDETANGLVDTPYRKEWDYKV